MRAYRLAAVTWATVAACGAPGSEAPRAAATDSGELLIAGIRLLLVATGGGAASNVPAVTGELTIGARNR